MKSSFNKDIARSIRSSLGRFLAIAGIVALGVGFYSGLRMTAPDMKLAADSYFDAAHLMDIRVVSTLGLSEDDIAELASIEGVDQVMPAYETDVVALVNGNQTTIRIHSLHPSALTSDSSSGTAVESDDAGYLNRLILTEGNWPAKVGECVIFADKVDNNPTQIGDTITVQECLSDLDATLTARSYTVVGMVHSSYYPCSSNMGSTSLGSGSVQQLMYVPDETFASDLPYTEAFITVKGADDLHSAKKPYDDAVREVQDRIEAIAGAREQARLLDLKADAQSELDDARAEFEQQKEDAEAQLDDAKAQLDSAEAALVSAQQQLESGQAQYDAGVAQLAASRKDAEQQLASGQASLDDSKAQLEETDAQLRQGAQQLAAQWQAAGVSPDQASAALANLQLQLESLPDTPENAAARAALQAQIDGINTLLAAQSEYDANKALYDAGLAAYEQGVAQLEAQRSTAEQQFASAQARLDESAAQLRGGRAQLEQGRVEYEQGLAEYESSKEEAAEQFAEAEEELERNQRKIDDLEAPEWLVMNRDKNVGVVSYESDADRVDHIASVFPFLFFLVAALVALTTMTRMVEEGRGIIGTYKALGYSTGRIASKYLVYAAAASGIGSAVGVAALSKLLPFVIMYAYAIIYYVPHTSLPIDWPIVLLSAGLGMTVTLGATWAAVVATLREKPAALMQPRAPKAGKRILLERITPLWRRFSFLWKVTFRNLFRYKKRLFMTVVGIAGCTALLLTGLGLHDSINDIIDVQYGELVHYNVAVDIEDELDAESQEELEEILEGKDNLISDSTALGRISMLVSSPQESDIGASVIVSDDVDGLSRMMTFRERITGEQLSFDDDSVLLTEKMATKLGVGVGDTVSLGEQDAMGNATGVSHDCIVSGITENYVFNYVYLGGEAYREAFDENPVFSTYYAVTSSDEATRAQLNEELRAIDGVKTVGYNDETINAYREMLKSVDLVVVVLVVAAAALAFIVLYNLTNINITERIREIATLKVLGFTPSEVRLYIFREIILLAALGALAGMVLGIFLEGFVVVTAEVDQVMFGRSIHALSFAIAFALTMVFTELVALFMRRKLSDVNMVEALKSNE